MVWNATRDKGVANRDEIESKEMIGSSKSRVMVDFVEFDPDDMQVSPKSGPVMDSEDIAKMVEDKSSGIKITDEEVKKTREQMMMSSKLGFVMSEEEVRKMLEDRAKEEEKTKVEPAKENPSKVIISDEEVKRMRDMMMSTSKSGRIMSDDKIREMLEEQKKESEKKAEPEQPEQQQESSAKDK